MFIFSLLCLCSLLSSMWSPGWSSNFWTNWRRWKTDAELCIGSHIFVFTSYWPEHFTWLSLLLIGLKNIILLKVEAANIKKYNTKKEKKNYDDLRYRVLSDIFSVCSKLSSLVPVWPLSVFIYLLFLCILIKEYCCLGYIF